MATARPPLQGFVSSIQMPYHADGDVLPIHGSSLEGPTAPYGMHRRRSSARAVHDEADVIRSQDTHMHIDRERARERERGGGGGEER